MRLSSIGVDASGRRFRTITRDGKWISQEFFCGFWLDYHGKIRVVDVIPDQPDGSSVEWPARPVLPEWNLGDGTLPAFYEAVVDQSLYDWANGVRNAPL